MAWKARLTRVTEFPFPSDAIEVSVTFINDTEGKTFERDLKLSLEHLQTAQQFRDLVAAELARLNNRSQVVAILKTQIGNEMT